MLQTLTVLLPQVQASKHNCNLNLQAHTPLIAWEMPPAAYVHYGAVCLTGRVTLQVRVSHAVMVQDYMEDRNY